VPLAFGVYWKRATTQGAVAAIAAGSLVWMASFPQLLGFGETFPGQLAGLLASIMGMVAGSLAPQWLADKRELQSRLA
jgi:Na+/proline symporter